MNQKKNFQKTIAILIIGFLFVSCGSNGIINNSVKSPESETVFEVSVPEVINENETIFLEVIDEVTGIILNPTRYEMQKKDEYSFYTRIPITNGSILKYRYIKRSDNIDTVEYTSTLDQIHYRTYLVIRPSVVTDFVYSWSETETTFPMGEISGYVYDQKTNLPIPEVLITINGMTTMSSMDGFYQINNIPAGQYYLTALHPNGLFDPFQQSAVIAENAVTPASFGLDAAKMVSITFQLEVPENTPEGIPIRILGDKLQLGIVYTQLDGGTSIIAARAPQMDYLENGKYEITLELPAGADLHYKFSMGDGFVNAERDESGKLFTRQLIIPSKKSTIKTRVISWVSSASDIPLTIEVKAPDFTPDGDTLSIQVNPYVWMQPFPIWKIGENLWQYTFFGPYEYLENAQFRFCRNDQCGYADDELTAGRNASGFIFNAPNTADEQSISYTIENWANFVEIPRKTFQTDHVVQKNDFIKGIAFSEQFDPIWLPYFDWGFINAAIAGSDSIIFSPSWTFANKSLSRAYFDYKNNPSLIDLDTVYNYAQEADLNLILYPQPDFDELTSREYWSNTSLSYNWWIEWFSQYERFINNYAYYAEIKNIDSIIIGGPSILPALPSGRLPGGSPSNTPYDFPDKWLGLIDGIREIYNGNIIFSISPGIEEEIDYQFLQNVDAIMVESIYPLSSKTSPSISEIESRYAQVLDKTIYSVYDKYQKPILIGINYPSINGSASDCINYDHSCNEMLEPQNILKLEVDLSEQSDIYEALLSAIVDRNWISGVVSIGYSPAVIVQDTSASIHGKPAMDVVSHYFNSVINN